MNTLDIAKAVTEDDINNANELFKIYDEGEVACAKEVNSICVEKGLNPYRLDTVFALTYARLNK